MTADRFIEILQKVVSGLEETPKAISLPTNATDAYLIGVQHGKNDCARFLLAKFNEFVEDPRGV